MRVRLVTPAIVLRVWRRGRSAGRRGPAEEPAEDEQRGQRSAASPAQARPDGFRQSRSLWGLMRYFGKLGVIGFGGPIALAGYMRRDLVEDRGWYTDREYQQGFAFAAMTPGPLAAHLAMWFGFLERGPVGALLVPLPMIAPPVVLVAGLAVAYKRYQGLPWVQQIFLGVGPAVLVIVALAAVKLARTTNKRDPILWAIALLVGGVTAFTGTELVWLFAAAGCFGAIYYGGGLPKRGLAGFVPLPLSLPAKGVALGSTAALGSVSLFFLQVGALTFGSGLAAAPLIHQGLVVSAHLLTEQQFVDTVALGLITPGPVVVMATFAGYLVDGLTGAAIATVAVFLPIYLLVAFLGNVFLRYAERPRMAGFVKGVIAAAAGAIAGAALVIGRQTISGWLPAGIALAALLLLRLPKVKVPEPVVVLLAAGAGLLLH